MYRVAITFLTLVSLGLGSILDGDLDIVEGVRLVSIPVPNSLEDGARSLGGNTVLGRTAKFLQGHELMVRLPKLIEKDKLLEVFGEGLKVVDETARSSKVTGRGKHGGGGGGAAALLGLMFAKALGAAGIGALGLLTMKALAVSALALLLSAIVGAKKMSHHDHDEHQVIYAGHHGHHRRKRDIETPLPYQGWLNYASENSS